MNALNSADYLTISTKYYNSPILAATNTSKLPTINIVATNDLIFKCE